MKTENFRGRSTLFIAIQHSANPFPKEVKPPNRWEWKLWVADDDNHSQTISIAVHKSIRDRGGLEPGEKLYVRAFSRNDMETKNCTLTEWCVEHN